MDLAPPDLPVMHLHQPSIHCPPPSTPHPALPGDPPASTDSQDLPTPRHLLSTSHDRYTLTAPLLTAPPAIQILMREKVVKMLELSRQGAWGKVIVHLQRLLRGHLARRTSRILRTLAAGCVEVQAALDKKTPEPASARLEELRRLYDSSRGLAKAVPQLRAYQRQLATLDASVQTLRLHQSVIDSLPVGPRPPCAPRSQPSPSMVPARLGDWHSVIGTR